MLKVCLDTFHALPRISFLVKKIHGAFKPSNAWLRDASYIVNLQDIQEASGLDVTCVVVRISDMERLKLSSKTMPVMGSCVVTITLLPISLSTAGRKCSSSATNGIGIGFRVYRDELDVFLAELPAVGARAGTVVDSL